MKPKHTNQKMATLKKNRPGDNLGTEELWEFFSIHFFSTLKKSTVEKFV